MIVAALTHLVLARAVPRLAGLRWQGCRLVRRIAGRRVLARRPDDGRPRPLPSARPVLLPRR